MVSNPFYALKGQETASQNATKGDLNQGGPNQGSIITPDGNQGATHPPEAVLQAPRQPAVGQTPAADLTNQLALP